MNPIGMIDVSIRLILLLAIPVALLQLGLMIGALVHLLKRNRTRNMNVIGWVVIIVLVNIIGPILYFTMGRVEE